MKVHIYRVTHLFVVDIPDDRNQEEALQEALALVKENKVGPQPKCDTQHVGVIPEQTVSVTPKNLQPGDVLRRLTRLPQEASYRAANAVGLLDMGDPDGTENRAQWLSVVMQRASQTKKFKELWEACATEGLRVGT